MLEILSLAELLKFWRLLFCVSMSVICMLLFQLSWLPILLGFIVGTFWELTNKKKNEFNEKRNQ